jgi:hypothetical protein
MYGAFDAEAGVPSPKAFAIPAGWKFLMGIRIRKKSIAAVFWR